MKIILRLAVYSLIITSLLVLSNVKVYAAGSPLQISPLNVNSNSPCGVFYNTNYSFTYNGGTVWLSSMFTGNGDIYTDDKIDILVTRSDNSTQSYSKNYGNGFSITPTVPQNVTYLFKPGNNTVNVKMTDIAGPICNSSQYWLVETSNGGGSGAPKPTILSRSAWNGVNSGPAVAHTPKRIAIHHTKSSNDPGNIGTWARELKIAILSQPANILFNPVGILNPLGNNNYTEIRGTWAGEVWLVWAAHKYLDNYGDIGYQYLVDPLGNIYEGSYKGGKAETAEVRGSNVEAANTGLIGISFLGRYGTDGYTDSMLARFDGGVAQPTNASIQSGVNLVNWLASKYGISKNGMIQIDRNVNGEQSCQHTDPNLCYIETIAGHRDYGRITGYGSACPGDNLYAYLSTFRGTTSQSGNGSVKPHTNPKGILVGGFSPLVLGIVDPSGKRLGIDPNTGLYKEDIVGGVYGKLSLFDFESDENNIDVPYWLHLPTPQSGVYKIDVVGTGNGSFKLAAEDLETSSAMLMQGNVTTGSKDNYQIIYSTSNPSQLELFHDTVPPVTTGTMTCSRDMQGICRSSATFKLTATDTGTNGDRASGVSKIECSYDNKITWQQCGDANGATIVRNTNGTFSFWYRSTDRVLNVEAPKYSGVVDVEKFVSLATTSVTSSLATTLQTTGIMHSNGNMSFTNNTTVRLDILNYMTTFAQSGNTTFTVNTNTKVTQSKPLPSYPLSSYKSRCTNYTGAVTLWDTGTNFNKCIYATGDVTLNTTNTSGKLTVVSEGNIKDNSTGANLQAWDTTNGVLFYTAKTYTALANGARYTGVIYAPNTQINAGLSNTTLNGGLYSKIVNFNSGTSLTANQAAGFPTTTYNLPL